MSAKVTQLLNPFNAQQFDPTQSSGQLPIGKHPVAIVDGEVKATKNNDGGYLHLTLKITDGPQTGTTGPYRLNLYNQNAQTAEIAHRQLSAIAHVTGVLAVQDVRQLFNIPFIVEVGPQKNDPQYTEVKRVFDINGNEPGKQSAQPTQQQGFGQPQQQPAQSFNQQPAQQQSQAPAWGQQSQPAQSMFGQNFDPNRPLAPEQAAIYDQGQYHTQQAWPQQTQQASAWSQQPAQQQPSNAPAWGQQAGSGQPEPWGPK